MSTVKAHVVVGQLVRAMQRLACIRTTEKDSPQLVIDLYSVADKDDPLRSGMSLSYGTHTPHVYLVRQDYVSRHMEYLNFISLDRFMRTEPYMERGLGFSLDLQQANSFQKEGVWWGLPLISNYYLVHFNTTTLADLGLPFPPPWGMPVSDWTWERFVEYAITITKRTGVSNIGFFLLEFRD